VRAFLPAAVVLAIGCSKPAPPTLTPDQAAVTSIDVQGIGLSLTMSVTNPNADDLSARGITSHVVVDKTHDVGTVSLPKTLTLPAGQTTKIVVPVSLNGNDVGVLAQVAATNGNLPYSVDGTLDMGGKLLHVGVPFHLDGTLSHEQLVGATLKSLPKLPF
jgi:hypothetical protein